MGSLRYFMFYLFDPELFGYFHLQVALYNRRGRGRANFGYPGVIYNAGDIDNFDFVYFRLAII